jgi:hypothetical protein
MTPHGADRRSADEIERLVRGMRAGVRANREAPGMIRLTCPVR